MIKVQEQKKEQSKNKYVKHARGVQKAKEFGVMAIGAGVVVGAATLKYGKVVVENAPKVIAGVSKIIFKA